MKKFIIGATALSLTACASPDDALKTQQIIIKEKTEQVQTAVETIPSWYLQPPKNEKIVYSVGTALMPDLQLSVDIARLNAKEQLADRLNSRLRSQTKTYIAKIGSDDLDVDTINEVEKATKNIVADAQVNGYTQQELIVVPSGTQFRAYTLLAYDVESAARVIRNRIMTDRAMTSKLRANDAFRDLDQAAEKVKEDEARRVNPDRIGLN